MKALIHEKIAGVEGVNWTDTEKPEPKTGEVLIKLQTAGMNRRDLAVITKRHKENDPPLIPGSDGAGVVEATGNDVKRFDVGQEVIINPSLGGSKTVMFHRKDSILLVFQTTGPSLNTSFCQSHKWRKSRPNYHGMKRVF